MEYTFHLGFVSYQSTDSGGTVEENTSLPSTSHTQTQQQQQTPQQSAAAAAAQQHLEVPKFYAKLERLIEFDTFVAIHGPGTNVDVLPPHKRKANMELGPAPKHQKTIYPAYFIPELAHVVAMCDEKIPFLNLAQEFSKHNISHSGLQLESNATSLVLKLLTLPMPTSAKSDPNLRHTSTLIPIIERHVWNDLLKRLLSVSIRSQMSKNNQIRAWVVEFVFYSTPLRSTHQKEQGNRRTVYLTYDQVHNDCSKTVEDLLKDWSKIVYLYSIVYDFAQHMKSRKCNVYDIVSVKSYSYMNLLLGYGPKWEVTCNIYWSSHQKGFRMVFVGGLSAINAHSMMREQLQAHLNRNHDLMHIVQILFETYHPLSSISKLPIIPHLGIPRPQVPVLSFCILPQSPTLLRLAYQAMYCLEVRLRAGRLVSIRDGAYSRFDRSNVIEEFTPTQGLKGFLSKYVDENAVYRRRSQSEDDNPPSPIAMEDNHGGPGTGGSSPFLGSGMRGPQSPRDSGLRFPAPHTPPSISNPHTPASPHPIGGQNHPNFSMTSPPAQHMPHPSPSGLMPSSPLNPQPSPMAHSPGPNLYMQGHSDSPYTAMSPAATNWPGSPSMPRPSPRPGQSPEHKPQTNIGVPTTHLSRVLPNRSWAGAVPTLLTHEAFEKICCPCPHPNKDITGTEVSPLERFLGCVYMRRHLQRNIQAEEALTALNSNEPGVVLFKVDGLQCQVFLNQIHMQSLHLKISQLPMPPSPDGKPPFQLSPDDLLVIEQFFESRVAVPPYRPNALYGFCRALNCSVQVLKDFVQIMRLELKPELGQGTLRWTVQLCMRVPPSAAPIVPTGSPGVLICRLKILFFLQITRIPYNGKDWKDSPSLVLPMVYDLNTNITQLAERREQVQSPSANAASAQLRKFTNEKGSQYGECSLFPAVRDLLTNLTLPSDVPQGNQNIVPSPVHVVASPGPMMHSPMQQIGQVGPPPQGYPTLGPGPNQGPN